MLVCRVIMSYQFLVFPKKMIPHKKCLHFIIFFYNLSLKDYDKKYIGCNRRVETIVYCPYISIISMIK